MIQTYNKEMTKKEFMKMLEKADVDDTVEFWEGVYDRIVANSLPRSELKKWVEENQKEDIFLYKDQYIGYNQCLYDLIEKFKL